MSSTATMTILSRKVRNQRNTLCVYTPKSLPSPQPFFSTFADSPRNLGNTLCVSTPKPLPSPPPLVSAFDESPRKLGKYAPQPPPPSSPGPLIGVLDELTEYYDGEIAAWEAKCNEQKAWLDHASELIAEYEQERIAGMEHIGFLTKCLYANERALTQCLYAMTLIVSVLLIR